jgi:hypothetical protein
VVIFGLVILSDQSGNKGTHRHLHFLFAAPSPHWLSQSRRIMEKLEEEGFGREPGEQNPKT